MFDKDEVFELGVLMLHGSCNCLLSDLTGLMHNIQKIKYDDLIKISDRTVLPFITNINDIIVCVWCVKSMNC